MASSLACLLGSSQAGVVEFWDFEDGVAGEFFTPNGQPNGSGGSTGSEGTLMRGFNETFGPAWTATTSPTGGSLGMRGINQDGYVLEGALHNWTSPSWTVELSVNFNSFNGWETMVGRDGTTVGSAESDFYFQRMGASAGADEGKFRLSYVDNTDTRHVLVSDTVLATETWYGLAAVIDNTAGTISLYIDDGSGYTLESQLTGLSGGDLGIKDSALNWTFNRGWFNGAFVDQGDATYDNIRFSDTALAPSELIAVSELSPDTFPLVITPNATTPGNYDFSWASQEGKIYDLVSNTSLETTPGTWPVWLDNGDIAASAPVNTLLNVPGGGDSKRFFAVVEKDPSPLFETDFESNNGGFSSSFVAGTEWEYGDPNSTDNGGILNPGGSVTEGNGGSTNCWGTSIGNPGYYANPTTNSCLRSPNIDLTGVTSAELVFAEALDLDAGDTAVVRLFAVGTPDVDLGIVYTATDGNLSDAGWADANSGNPIDLSAGVGSTVYLQWCLTGTGGTSQDFMGWYIDDVVVTGN